MNYTFQTGYLIFEERINILFELFNRPVRLGIACSGGPDSILLLHYIATYKKKNFYKIELLLLIHIIDGHELIEKSLEKTMQAAYNLVIEEANNLLIEYKIYTNTNKDIFFQKLSIEALCHTIRKNFFENAINDFKLDRILTGHTLTDQLEHFFIGIIRHASLQRISGMKEDSQIYFRPLLFMPKENTQVILNDINKKYVLDPCNNNTEYLRNKLRKNLLPLLNNIDNRFEAGIIHLMDQVNAQETLMNKLVLIEYKKDNISELSYFLTLDTIIKYKIIEKYLHQLKHAKNISLSLCKEIIRFLETKKNGVHNINNICINKKNNNWHISLKKE